jgi:hypothetical protein
MRMLVGKSFGLLKVAFPEGGSSFVPLRSHRNQLRPNAHSAQ